MYEILSKKQEFSLAIHWSLQVPEAGIMILIFLHMQPLSLATDLRSMENRLQNLENWVYWIHDGNVWKCTPRSFILCDVPRSLSVENRDKQAQTSCSFFSINFRLRFSRSTISSLFKRQIPQLLVMIFLPNFQVLILVKQSYIYPRTHTKCNGSF